MNAALEPASAHEAQLVQWAGHTLHATVTHVVRQPRWRPMWRLTADDGSGPRDYYLRGERPPDFTPAFPLTHEHAVHDLLLAHGLPAPRVHGYHAEPPCLLMDAMPGRFNLATARDEAERQAVLAHYTQLLVQLHAIPLDACRAAGLAVPAPGEGALALFKVVEAQFEASRRQADPLVAFGRKWVHRHAPTDVPLALTTYDAGQFLFEDGRVTALLDFELAHVTDPHADLAALLLRDTVEPMGDLGAVFRDYERLTGQPLRADLIDFHIAAWAMVTPLVLHAPLAAPAPDTDAMTYQTWYVDNAAWALEAMARRTGTALPALPEPAVRASRHDALHHHLLSQVEAVQGSLAGFARSQARQALRLARHLHRVAQVGEALQADSLREIEQQTGVACGSWEAGQQALEAHVQQAGPEQDAALIALLHRLVQRQHMLLGEPGSRIRRHPALQRPHG